jgi:hypothetical protein
VRISTSSWTGGCSDILLRNRWNLGATPRSNTKQDAFIAKINDDAAAFLSDDLRPALTAYADENAGEGNLVFVNVSFARNSTLNSSL